MKNIEGWQASIIVDRCKPPTDTQSKQRDIKSVLWCLRGIGAPGKEIECSREVIEDRTCLSRSVVYRVIRVLLEHEILTQTRSPSPNKTAAYIVNYDKLALWLRPEDQQIVGVHGCQADTRTGVTQRPDRVSGRDPSKSTGVSPTRTGVHQTQTGVTQTPDIKEVPADPAIPAPTPSPEQIDQWLTNIAVGGGAAGPRMDAVEWEILGKKAKLPSDYRLSCASILATKGVQDAELGLAAMEKLADRLGSKTLNNPMGLFSTIVDGKEQTGPCAATIKRHRERDDARRQLAKNIELNWSDELKRHVYHRVRTMLADLLGEEEASIMAAWRARDTLLDWDAMLDFIAANWKQIGKANKPNTEGKAA